MANTYTQIVTAATLAAAGAVNSNPVDTTLQAGTGLFALEAVVTNGSSGMERGKKVRVYFVTSNVDYTPTAAELEALSTYARSFDIECKNGAGAITHRSSMPFVPTGTHLYTWVDHDLTVGAAVLNLYLTEIPQT